MRFEPEEITEIDAETEDLAYFMTLLIKTVNPKIQCGPTYEILIGILIQLLAGPIDEQEAISYGQMILKTQFDKNAHQRH